MKCGRQYQKYNIQMAEHSERTEKRKLKLFDHLNSRGKNSRSELTNYF